MEIRFAPVPPPKPVRAPAETRAREAETRERIAPSVRAGDEGTAQNAQPDRTAGGRSQRTEAPAAVDRGDLPLVRIQPELPQQTRNALEVFVQNSFSEEEDPAASLSGIDLYV